MPPGEGGPDIARILVALVLVVVAAIALLVAVGVAVGRVAPDIGGDDIVEAGDDVRTFSNAEALVAATGCEQSEPFDAFEGIGNRIRSYAKPTGARCVTEGTFGLVYVDRNDRRVAEDDNDVRDRVCATVQVLNAPDATTTAPPVVDPNATVTEAPATTAPPATTAATSTTLPEVTFGLVRGPNWILVSPAGRDAATTLQSRLGGEVFTKTCEPPTEQ
jgi:hypothetical protein